MKSVIKLFLFIACLLSITCTTSSNRNLQRNLGNEFIDSLKSKTTQARVLFYVNFLKSKMEISDLSALRSKDGLDSIFQFIGNRKLDSCSFSSNMVPDGEIEFYENSKWLTSMQFVLTDQCDGFYTDFTKKSIKYEMTSFGKLTLLKLKRNLPNHPN